MHPSSMNNMKKAKKIIHSSDDDAKWDILDVGGRSLDLKVQNRSYSELFVNQTRNYFVSDLVAGPGVTHPMPGPYTLPFEDDSIDLVLSGQTLEHVKNPFRSVAEMCRVLKPDSYIILIAPSGGPRHDSIDCWRFMDDGFKAIAEEVGLEVVSDWIDKSAPDERSRKWADHIFIGKKYD